MANFRLATLLKLRERERDEAAKRVQDARLAIKKLQDARGELDEENTRMNEIRKGASHGRVDMHSILDTQRFQMSLMAQMAQIDSHLGELDQELERREQALLLTQQKVKSLEKLRDQREEQAVELALIRQQSQTDEWASVRSAIEIHRHEAASKDGGQ